MIEEGDFKVSIYYTCPEGDEGSRFSLSLGENELAGKIETAFDPPLRGMENDRTSSRAESYVKDFKALDLGTMHLDKGEGQLTLQAQEIPGQSVMDVRLLLFEKQ